MSATSAQAPQYVQAVEISSSRDMNDIIDRLPEARIAIFGDLCVDAYWWLDAGSAERSVETGLPITHVGRQHYGLGAAGNVAVNATVLGVRQIALVGVVGRDCFGHLLLDLAQQHGIDASGVIMEAAWQTMVYAKPMAVDGERSRFDFGVGNQLNPALITALTASLERAAAHSDVVVLNQQVGAVLADPGLVVAINDIISRHPDTRFLVDARMGADRYRGATLKVNAGEAARLLGRTTVSEPIAEELARELAVALHAASDRAVFLTRGERGVLVVDAGMVTVIPGVVSTGAIDPVGAGDAVTSALAAALAIGISAASAARLANLAGAVSVRKLHTTGSANPAELREMAVKADFLHAPELAEDHRRRRCIPGSEIEVIRGRLVPIGAITHAIFDHDGTISTLRQGWEAVMEPMMMRAVLGARHADAPADVHERVLTAVRALIDRTTGIQTLAQMEELIGLVRSFGLVPPADIRDCHGYKKVYNDALLDQIRGRTARLAAGELIPDDFIIRGSVELLRHLHTKGVRLYLASGTDVADVAAEATALGYADLFTGGIHGAVGSLAVEAKRDVMDRIMRENGIDGSSLLVVGDGPVEIREGRRRGALCLGIASDEPRRYGLDLAKRSRLIRAGADYIVGDFIQRHHLLPALGLA